MYHSKLLIAESLPGSVSVLPFISPASADVSILSEGISTLGGVGSPSSHFTLRKAAAEKTLKFEKKRRKNGLKGATCSLETKDKENEIVWVRRLVYQNNLFNK